MWSLIYAVNVKPGTTPAGPEEAFPRLRVRSSLTVRQQVERIFG